MGNVKSDRQLRPAARVDGLTPYRPPPRPAGIDLVLDANEGPQPDRALLAALAPLAGGKGDELRRYPRAVQLEESLAARYRIESSRVVVTNGGDEAIDRVCRAVLDAGSTLLVHEPTFEMIPRGARLAGAGITTVEWSGGAFPVERMLAHAAPPVRMIAMVSPNNPTGAVIPSQDLVALADAAADIGAVAMVDLAYVEFAESDPTPALLARPNVVLVRTLSKAFGLAGLRVGYAIASQPVATWLRTVGGPYPVSSLSLLLAEEAIARPDASLAYIRRVRAEREELRGVLSARGADPLPTEANFVAARVRAPERVRDGLAARGVAIRMFDGDSRLWDLVRITLPGETAAFARLLSAIEQVEGF